jgi:predicted metal-dependent phosphoesterase TrpH
LIDLHTHTTASDGLCPPDELVARASAAGVHVLAVTDHDTVAGCAAVEAACLRTGIAFVPGIEITAVMADQDVHVLGYFIDPESEALQSFLSDQRRQRVERVHQIVARLADHGITLDADAILEPATADATMAVGRPWIARALVAGGHVAHVGEAFDRWLSRGRPAFVPRRGASPADVFRRVHAAGGIVSLAHPVLTNDDDAIPGFARAGLDALEAYHSKHDEPTTLRYVEMAHQLGLATSGGSDFHGDPTHGPSAPGAVSLPPEAFERLKARVPPASRSSARPDAPPRQVP